MIDLITGILVMLAPFYAVVIVVGIGAVLNPRR